jgi:hypothetical protein
MVKLASGDMVRFETGNNGEAVLQVIGRDDAPRIEKEGRGWRDGDTVVLTGSEVALLLYRLTTANADGSVVVGAQGSSKLAVFTEHDELGRVTVVLETDDNVILMKAYERDMLVTALESQVWRLFQ